MGTNVLPALPGLDVQVERTGRFRTTIYETVGGKEQRVSWDAAPRNVYKLHYNALRDNVYLTSGSFSGSSEAGAVVGLFLSASGAFDSFTMTDPYTSGSVTVRFVEDTFTIRKVVSGVWEAEFQTISLK
jgi:hypothetical protein